MVPGTTGSIARTWGSGAVSAAGRTSYARADHRAGPPRIRQSPGVRIINGHETFKFLLDDQVLFRFKKGNEAGLSVNVPTQLALAFHNHNQDLLGLADVHRVEVVYQLNWLETEIFDVIVVGATRTWLSGPTACSTLLQRSYRCPCRRPATGSRRPLSVTWSARALLLRRGTATGRADHVERVQPRLAADRPAG